MEDRWRRRRQVGCVLIGAQTRIHGIGTDCQGIAETRQSLRRFGERYLRRVFAPRELAGIEKIQEFSQHEIRRLAGLFAAKEAVYKALRPPVELAGGWFQIDIGTSAERPDVCFSGAFRRWNDKIGGANILLSLSSTAGFVLAIAVAETTVAAVAEGKS